ncbi:GH92 family glycosyl hydrolase [Fulvivirgaceae bacterium BMA12]|uniref:GH92 family glycosyl hydrolase n=1 Tax=Agaribacillus aureus TaxID=3051825 RepID=A0ABT8L1V5_9BACT|nr:GH92 family glycosyl hydrolase [Fulvivirgaceae bacterium BMA12]
MIRFFQYLSLFAFLIIQSCSTPNEPKAELSLIQFVDPMIGTDRAKTISAIKHSESGGTEDLANTFPAVGNPNAMTNWTPQTRATEKKCLSPYYYFDTLFQGFRGSRFMSGSCTQDYGSFTLMPMTGELQLHAEKRASSFSHDDESASPAYYQVLLQDYQINAEMTGTTRAGFFRFTFLEGQQGFVVMEPNSDEMEGYIEIIPEKNTIIGYNPAHRIYQGWGEPAGFSGYFVAVFDQPFKTHGVHQWEAGEQPLTNTSAYVEFDLSEKNQVMAKIGTSFTSIENALQNLNAEVKGWDFDAVKTETQKNWEDNLGVLHVKGQSEEDLTLFYTALYHANILPRVFSDTNGSYPGFADNQETQLATGHDYYADFATWDSYRTLHPMLTITDPKKQTDMVKSLIRKAEQGGWLPIFPCWNQYTAAMIGDHVISVIGDAYIKGLEDFNIDTAYHYMRKNAFESPEDFEAYKNGKGRRALNSYLRYGYIPMEDSVKDAFHKNEQVSRTLEYAYDDFVLAQVAKKMGKTEDYQHLIKRAANYQNVFDTTIGFVRGRFADGSWVDNFDPVSRASYITEGSPYQYMWYVPQDVPGLIKLMGGEQRFVHRLDSMFEIGEYWHGNEPGHQTIYLYAWAGAPWKTQHHAREVLKEEYNTGPGGLTGNDDVGQMSAWAVMTMVGFYPVTPGTPNYIIGSPVFDEVTITPKGSQNTFTISTLNNSPENKYIQSATLNGQPFERIYLTHNEIIDGGVLQFEMGPKPNKSWAIASNARPKGM